MRKSDIGPQGDAKVKQVRLAPFLEQPSLLVSCLCAVKASIQRKDTVSLDQPPRPTPQRSG